MRAFEIGFQFFHVRLRIRDFARAQKERGKLHLVEASIGLNDNHNDNGEDDDDEDDDDLDDHASAKESWFSKHGVQAQRTGKDSNQVRRELDQMDPRKFEELASKVRIAADMSRSVSNGILRFMS